MLGFFLKWNWNRSFICVHVYIFFMVFDNVNFLYLTFCIAYSLKFFNQVKENMPIWSCWNIKQNGIFQPNIDSKTYKNISAFFVDIFNFLFFLFHNAWLELYSKLWQSPSLRFGNLEQGHATERKESKIGNISLGNSYLRASLKDEEYTPVTEYLWKSPTLAARQFQEKSLND